MVGKMSGEELTVYSGTEGLLLKMNKIAVEDLGHGNQRRVAENSEQRDKCIRSAMMLDGEVFEQLDT